MNFPMKRPKHIRVADWEGTKRRREAKLIYKQKFSGPKANKYNPWTEAEHKMFVEAVRLHGKDFLLISEFIGTRSKEQINSHIGVFQK